MGFINHEDVRVWWIPQVPMSNPFHVPVKTEEEAMLVLDTLAEYDKYQLDNHIKPDYCNMGGLEVEDGGEWSEYYNADGEDIDEIIERLNKED